MRATLNAIADELRRLKAGGVKDIVVSGETMVALRNAVEARAPKARTEQPQVASAPVVYSQLRQPAARHTAPKKAEPKLPPPPAVTLPEGDKKTRWDALLNMVTTNPVCLERVRPEKKVVLGVGNLDAKIFFCGEAPGAEEEIKGEPFVGPAGQLLTKMIQAMGVKREDVYIGNIMNWRPDLPTPPGREQIGNRPPTEEEMLYCMPYLRAQLEVVNPELIVALGATAAKALLGFDSFTTLGSIRGQWKEFEGKPLMVTYHPSFILRTPTNRTKRTVWEDFLKVMEKANMPITDKQRGYFLGR
ncbi:uracil-DNA glycosylase family 4 [Ereboglobus sp. PH5-10]|uniref:uracil-DNA glycosylase n=1 Tax=Ereboglobus sp. PH5-10 TaxID=2940629 RepID=UPI002406455F|nr:uracil-DNA glycosylase [Ereboglobus sp. PH5-10]MDF9826082.1 uracil-DNA glycosylase family 4 [Ereboglobus sp. PH5-10]